MLLRPALAIMLIRPEEDIMLFRLLWFTTTVAARFALLRTFMIRWYSTFASARACFSLRLRLI